MIRRPPRSTLDRSSAASDVYKRQVYVKDYMQRISKPKMKMIFKRLQVKRLSIKQIQHREKLFVYRMQAIKHKLILEASFKQIDFDLLLDSHQYQKIIEYAYTWLQLQASGVYYKFKINLNIEVNYVYPMLYAAIMTGHLKEATRISELCIEISSDKKLLELKGLLSEIHMMIPKMELCDYIFINDKLNCLLNIYPYCLDLLRLKVELLIKSFQINDENQMAEMIKTILCRYPEDSVLKKLYADFVYNKGDTEKAVEMYRDILNISTNGMVLLEISENLKLIN